MKTIKRSIVFMLLIGVLAACAPQATPTSVPPTNEPTDAPTAEATLEATTEATADATAEAAASQPRAFVLGNISDEPAETIEEFQPLADYLAANLSDYGITEGQVTVVSSLDEMAEMLESGEIDLYFDSAYPSMIISDLSGAEPILRRWKGGDAEYHTVIFTRADSGFTELADLNGQMVAFDEAASTSGYMLPIAYMIEAGLTPVEKASSGASVADDEVGFVFSGDDDNTIQWVLSGDVGAGAIDSRAYADIPEPDRADMTVLVETEDLPRQVTLLRPGVDDDMKEALIALLLGLDETPEGLVILDKFEETARFDEFPGDPAEALNRMRELYDLVQEASVDG